MKILYIAKHNSGGNDDECSISYSLRHLGHEVATIQETRRGNAPELRDFDTSGFDFILFHKCQELTLLKRAKPPKVFWDFDLVDGTVGGEDMRNRWLIRRQEIGHRVSVSQLGFCTDGDWVAGDSSGKLVHLMQGCDPRIEWMDVDEIPHVVSTARSDKVGGRRVSFMQFMRDNVPNFHQYEQGVHGEKLHRLIASAMICIGPDWPVTDRYFSNRLILTCGYGGLIMHRDSNLAWEMYDGGSEFLTYDTKEELPYMINHWSSDSLRGVRRDMRRAAFERTQKEHTYIHRCRKLIEIVRERLF